MPDTLTPNLSLDKPAISAYDIWGVRYNANLDILDAASATLRGTPVVATAPTLGQVLKFNGTEWAPAAESGGISGVGSIGKLAKWLTTSSLTNSILSDDGSTLLVEGNVNATGFYQVNGSQIALANLSDGTSVLLADGSRALSGNLAAGGNKITGLGLPTISTDAATKGYVDDLTPPAPADASTTVKGIAKLSVAPALASDPIAAGDNDARLSDARTPLAHSLTGAEHTAGTLAALNALLDIAAVATSDARLSDARAPIGAASGDLGSSYPSPSVIAIRGTSVSAVAPTDAQILKLVGGVWTPSSDLGQKQDVSEKGQPSGYAALDGSGKVPQAQLPAVAITDTFVVADQAARLALVAETGDVAIQQDVAMTYILRGTDPTINADWEQLLFPNTGVQSVSGTSPISVGGTLINPIISIDKATAALFGSARLSVAPASAADPISVGDNDPRVQNVAHGSGTTGTLAKWSSGTTLANSIISELSGVATVAGTLTVSTRTRSPFFSNGPGAAVTIESEYNGSSAGAQVSVLTANGTDNANGGQLLLRSGNGGTGAGAGGVVVITAGNAPTFGAGGSITLTSGNAANNGGPITLNTGSGGTTNGSIILMIAGVEKVRLASNGILEVSSQVKITGGAPGAGKVLTSDAVGLGTWATPTGGPASALGTTGADVVVNTAAPPTVGQVLTATSPTAANWQTPAGGGGGGWVKVADQVLGADANTFSAITVDLNTDGAYKIWIMSQFTAIDSLRIVLNGVTATSNYRSVVQTLTNTGSFIYANNTANSAEGDIGTGFNGHPFFVEGVLSLPGGSGNAGKAIFRFSGVPTNDVSGRLTEGAIWSLIVGNITSLNFKTTGLNNMKAGTRIIVWKAA